MFFVKNVTDQYAALVHDIYKPSFLLEDSLLAFLETPQNDYLHQSKCTWQCCNCDIYISLPMNLDEFLIIHSIEMISCQCQEFHDMLLSNSHCLTALEVSCGNLAQKVQACLISIQKNSVVTMKTHKQLLQVAHTCHRFIQENIILTLKSRQNLQDKGKIKLLLLPLPFF